MSIKLPPSVQSPIAALRSRSALPTTLTELNAMAAAAIMGESKMPNVQLR
jgi:hypothetical protein